MSSRASFSSSSAWSKRWRKVVHRLCSTTPASSGAKEGLPSTAFTSAASGVLYRSTEFDDLTPDPAIRCRSKRSCKSSSAIVAHSGAANLRIAATGKPLLLRQTHRQRRQSESGRGDKWAPDLLVV